MATTSSNLTAGAATSGGRGGNDTGHKRRAAGLVATAALGLALLTGTIFSEAHQAALPTTPPVAVNPSSDDPAVRPADASVAAEYRWDFGGPAVIAPAVSIPAGAPAQATARAQVWTGTCRAGGSECLPDEDYAAPAPADTAGADDLVTSCIGTTEPFACAAPAAADTAKKLPDLWNVLA